MRSKYKQQILDAIEQSIDYLEMAADGNDTVEITLKALQSDNKTTMTFQLNCHNVDENLILEEGSGLVYSTKTSNEFPASLEFDKYGA